MKNELFLRIISSIILLPISLFFIIKGSIVFNFFIMTCFFCYNYRMAYDIKK